MLKENLQSEEFKTGMVTGSKLGDIAKVLKEIVNAKGSSKIVEKNGEELFNDFYSNWKIEKKKTPIVGGKGTESDTSISSRDSYDAHNLNVESFGDKVTENNSNTQENEGSFSLAEMEERIDGMMGGRESIDEWLDTVGRRREGSRYDAEQRMSSEDKAID